MLEPETLPPLLWVSRFLLYLATVRHMVKPASGVFVRACTAIELVLPEVGFITSGDKSVVASPAIEDILAPFSSHKVVASPAMEYILAVVSEHIVGAVSPVELVLARV